MMDRRIIIAAQLSPELIGIADEFWPSFG